MNSKKNILFLLSLLFTFSVAFAQKRVIDYNMFNVDIGLPHRNVKVVFSDRDGIIWAATDFELSRFDGNYTKVYERKQLGSAIDNIKKISQDKEGFLWLWGAKGLFIFDPDEETYQKAPYEKDILDQFLQFIPEFPLQLPDGRVFFSVAKRPHIFVGQAGRVTRTLDVEVQSPFELLAVAGSTNLLWARSGSELLKLDAEGVVNQRIYIPTLGKIETVHSIGQDSLLIFTQHPKEGELSKLLLVNTAGGITDITQENDLGAITKVFYEEKEKIIWIEYTNRWELRKLTGELVVEVNNDREGQDFIYNTSSSWMYTTGNDGKVWVATEDGIVVISSKTAMFDTYFTKGHHQEEFGSYSIRGIWSDDQDIYAGAELAAVIRYDATTGKSFPRGYKYLKYIEGRGLSTTFKYPIQSDFRGVYRDADGIFWFGQQRVVIAYDETNTSFRTYPPAFSYDVEYGINPWCFHRMTHDGTLLVGAQPGVKYISPNGDSLRAYEAQYPFEALNNTAVYQILETPEQKLLLATAAGLFVASKDGKLEAHYHGKGRGRFQLPHDHLYGISAAGNGQYWLATNGTGLILFDLESGEKRQWTQREGLSDNRLYAVYEDDYGALWLTSDYGLMRLDTITNEIYTYTKSDGLPSNEFNRTAHFRSESGKLYFGTINGLIVVEPGQFVNRKDRNVPEVQIMELHKSPFGSSNTTLHTSELRRDSVITINPEDEYVQLTVSLPDYEKRKVEFFYRVDHSDWQPLMGNVLQLGRLNYGNHLLEVKGRVVGAVFAEQPLSLAIKVVRPFYLHPYFIIMMMMVMGGVVSSLIAYNTRQLTKRQTKLEQRIKEATVQLEEDRNLIKVQAEELEEVDRMKTRLFANISHELRTPLTLIMGPLEKLKQKKNLTSKERELLYLAEDNSRELLQTVNAIMDLAKLDIKGIQVERTPTNLQDLCLNCIDKFKERAKTLGVRLKVDNQLPPESTTAEWSLDGNKITTILNNLVANALRFTPEGGEVIIRKVFDKEGLLRLEVEDNGPGIPLAELPKLFDRFYQVGVSKGQSGNSGIGLALCKELAELMDGEMLVDSEQGKGSTFILQLPDSSILSFETKEGNLSDDVLEDLITPVDSPAEVTGCKDENGTVLIVEDNAGMRLYLESIISDCYRVEQASDGILALEHLRSASKLPDLIITDLMMPNLDGFGLVKQLKTTDEYRQLPLIVLSAKTSKADRISLLRYGVDDYLTKPFDELELMTRIQRLLKNSVERQLSTVEGGDKQSIETELQTDEELPEWLVEMEEFVINHLEDSRLTSTFLANSFHVSARQLQRRLKAQTGMTPGAYIREVRLNEALRYLELNRFSTVKKVSAKVGFRNPEYFSSLFYNRFGKLPSAYKK